MTTLKRKGHTGQSPIVDKPRPPSRDSQHSKAPGTPRLEDLMHIPMLTIDGVPINPLDANSYRVLDNLKRGLDPEENKNIKVTLDLLQKMDYKDLRTKDEEDNFKPSDVILT